MDLDTSLKAYLTDLEWLIILAILREGCTTLRFWTRFRVCEMGKFIHTIRSLDFFYCSPVFVADIHKNERRLVSEEELINGPTSRTDVICKNVEKLRQWLNNYLKLYSNDILISEETSCDFAHSLKNTLKLLKQYENFNSKNVVIRKNTPSNENQRICITNEMHLFEDLFILYLKEYITFLPLGYVQKCPERPHSIPRRAILDIDDVRRPVRRIEYNIPIRLNISVSEMALNLFPNEKLFREGYETIDTNTQEISQKLKEVNTQTYADFQNSQSQTVKPTILHKIDAAKDFLPYKDALVLLALYTKKDFLLFPRKAKEQLKAISQMKFIKTITGTAKHIKNTLKKSYNLPKRENLNITDDTCCIMLFKRDRLNDFVNKYLDKYQHDKLNNYSQYGLYNKSWDATVRVLNSERGEWKENYAIKPETIERHNATLKDKTTWIECLFLLVRTKHIQLTEVELKWGKVMGFSFGITQTNEIPLVANALCSYLDISITQQNEVKYRGYTINFKPTSREFIFLKFLLQNKGAKGRTFKIVAEYFAEEFKKLGLSFKTGEDFGNNLTGYKTKIKDKFQTQANKKKFSIDFEITAGKTENRLVPLSEYNKKMSRKGKKKSPRKA